MERCRFCNCMKLREFCENIFDNKQTNPTIPAIVELFTNLKIVENDPYTKFICSNCFHILIVFYKYRERVLETNQLLQNEIENKQNNIEDFHKKWPRIEQNDGQFVVYTPNFVDDYNTNLRIGNGGNNNDKDNQQLDKSNLCTEKSVSFIKNEIDMEGICVKIENDINDDEDQNIYENNHHLSIPFGDYDDNKTIINDNQINDNKDADIINDESRIEEFPSAIGNIGKSAKMSDTAKRCKNYSEVEKKQLLKIIKRYEYIIENKKTNSATIQRKKEAWETIAQEFNSTTINTRSSQQLKSLYKNLKCRGKKHPTQEHMETNKAGDETFKKSLSSAQELLTVSIEKNATPLRCSYDSECHYFENDSDNEDNQCLNSLIGDDKKITNNDKLYSRIVAGSNKYPGILKNNQFPNESISNNNNSSDKDNNEIINVQHTIRKLHQCNICDKKFTQRAHLKRHLIQHSGERPYPCTICDKKFVRNEHLRLHLKIHTGERPYQCTICDKKFVRNEHLRLHLKIHTGERPYQCTICDKKFIRKEYLKRHSIQQHTN